MAITVSLPGPLRELADGRARIELEGAPATVGDALVALRASFPAIYDRLVTEEGDLRPHVNLFVGTEDIHHTGGLATPIGGARELVVIPAVSGG